MIGFFGILRANLFSSRKRIFTCCGGIFKTICLEDPPGGGYPEEGRDSHVLACVSFANTGFSFWRTALCIRILF